MLNFFAMTTLDSVPTLASCEVFAFWCRAAGSRDWVAVMATEEALRLPKSVPVVEGVGQIDRVVGEEGRPRGGDDEEILRFMDSVDDYLLLMDSLNSALRQVCCQRSLIQQNTLTPINQRTKQH